MIGFVVPFKSKARSKNWALDCALLRRTLSSVLNQTSDNYKCFVVYADMPDEPVTNAKIEWLKFPFPFLQSHEIEDEERCAVRYGLGKFLPNFYDQGKKIMYGCTFAKKAGCDYIMSLDADDLLSNKLVRFLDENKGTVTYGWYVNKGYIYAEKSRYLLRVPHDMNYVCASVNIIRRDIVPDPDLTSKRYQDFQFFSSHAYMPEGIKNQYNQDLLKIPFYCTTYVIHNSNFFTNSNELTRFSWRNVAKRLVRGAYLSKNKRKEFGLYNLPL